jgi:acid phosphatase family membrane protein YuiD
MIHDTLLLLEPLVIPLTALIITQFIKVLIDRAHGQKTSMNAYGGMPSSHSALFIALVLVAWREAGPGSVAFAIAVILYLTVVRDAVGIRQHLGSHGAMLKSVIAEHQKDHAHTIPHEKIVTRLGHTPLQAMLGTLCGLVITLLLFGLFDWLR